MKNKHCLFFIHGFCSGPEDWKNQFVFFKDKFRVEIPLLRGHDNKNSNNLPISIEQLSLDCAEFIIKNNIQNIVFIGHSMGTRIAVYLANLLKNRTIGLVLVDGSKFCDQKNYSEIIRKFENSIKENKYEDILSEMFSEMIFSNKFNDLKEFVIERALSIKFEISKTLRRNAIWFDGHCLEPILKSLNVPILLMQSTTINKFGKRMFINTGNLSDIPYIDFVKENCANSFDKIIFQKTGHYISVEKSEDFNKNLLNWLLNKIFKDK